MTQEIFAILILLFACLAWTGFYNILLKSSFILEQRKSMVRKDMQEEFCL